MNKEHLKQQINIARQVTSHLENNSMRIKAFELVLNRLLHKREHSDEPSQNRGANEGLSKDKQPTLAEITRSINFSNGQERVTAIIGYHEMIQGEPSMPKGEIREAWLNSKMNGQFAKVYLDRAVRDGLIREVKSEEYDLSQTGEQKFETIIENYKNES